jgi:hypothetical protein
VLAVFVTATLALATLVGAAADAARARTAADAAALAGASGGRRAAAALAESNGARLISYEALPGREFPGSGVVVVVAVGEARAAARAEMAPVGDA